MSLKEEGNQTRACSVGHAVVLGKQQATKQRQLGAVVFLAGVFAAFIAVSEQLPLSADDFFFFLFLPLPLVHSFPKAACFKQEPDCTRG